MTASHQIDHAAGLVLGCLSPDERAAAHRRAAVEPGFAALAEAWDARLAPLALTGEAALPDGLLARIEARIAASGAELPGTVTRRAAVALWEPVLPGLERCMLFRNEAARRQTLMVRMQAGAVYPQHGHDGQDEEIYILEGDLVIGELTLSAGDFHLARADRVHPLHVSRTGCVALINQGY